MSAFAPEDPHSDSNPATTSEQPTMTTDMDVSHNRHSHNPLLGNNNPLVSDLEQEVLDEYSRLLGNVNQVCIVSQSHPPPISCS